MFTRGHHSVVDEADRPVNKDWEKSDCPTRCPACEWSGPLKDINYLGCGCFPFRCPKCGSIVAHMKNTM